MSRWTHVSGCIRIDGLPGLLPASAPTHNYAAVLGRPAQWDDEHEAENIPFGSEGSIQYAVSHAGDGMVWKTVAVWGDLRDFGSEEAGQIDAWFQRIVESELMLRAASLLVEIEGGARYLLVAEDGKRVQRVDLPSEVPS